MGMTPRAIMAPAFRELIRTLTDSVLLEMQARGATIDGLDPARITHDILTPGAAVMAAKKLVATVETPASPPCPVTAPNLIGGIWVAANVAPTGAAIAITLFKNGAAITAAGAIVLPATTTRAWHPVTPESTLLTTREVARGDALTFGITQVGSTEPGNTLVVAVFWDVRAKTLGV